MQKTKYIAFDLEIAKILEGDFSQWRNNRPLGITCAATQLEGETPLVWHSKTRNDEFEDQMSQPDLLKLIEYLEQAVNKGYQILTWNGLGFDFEVLAEESGCWDRCKNMALNHTDMMFHFLCIVGYPIALDKAAKGLGLAGKPEGMSGDLAPILWKQGEYRKVLEYVAQDAQSTLDVAKETLQAGKISWLSQRGRKQSVSIPNGWVNVVEASKLPNPDVSWMSNPINRQDFFRWTKP